MNNIVFVPFTQGQLQIDLSNKTLIKNGKPVSIKATYNMSKWWKESLTPLNIETIAYIAIRLPNMPIGQWGLLNAVSDTGELTADDLYLNNRPIESLKYKGFYIVCGYERFVVNEQGLIKDNYTGDIANIRLHQAGRVKKTQYWKCTVNNHIKGTVTIGRYRVMLLAFVSPPSNPAKLDVNHINGISDDDRLENLEWATRQENSYHAYSTGLREDNKHVEVYDIITKEVDTFFSMGECSRAHDSNPSTIFHRCYNDYRVYEGRFLFRFKDSDKPWPAINEELLSTQATPSVVAYDIFNGELTVYKNATDAVQNCRGSMNPATVNNRANAGDSEDGPNNKPVHGYHFYRTWNIPEPLPHYNEDQIAYFNWCHENDKQVKMGFYVTNVKTGERVFANGHHEVKDIIGVQLSHNPIWRLGEPVKGFVIERIYESY